MSHDKEMNKGYAVAITLKKKGTETLQLVFDDLELSAGPPAAWRHWAFFTSMDIPKDRAQEFRLTQREYASIGEAVLARLMALQSLEDPED